MEEGRLVAWRKREGERVEAGEVLFEVETDKATIEVESPASGVLRRILIEADRTAPVAEVIALISTTADEPLPDVAVAVPAAPPAPRVEGTQAGVATPSEESGERVRASPAARKRAEELGVDIASATGTGPGGRITLEDVARVAAAVPAATGERRQPLSRMRRAIADRMARSAREAPQFSVSREVDMAAADALRKREGVSYTDVLVAACARALANYPRLRSRFDGDALVGSEGVHVGIAVALADGLLVPVLRDADRKDLATIAREREGLETGAREGKLPADALTGGVFTISNLGPQGVDRFTAIVNPPEAAILAVGRVAERVVARDGAPAVRPTVTLTLSVDHRVADGAEAARFLGDVAQWLERADVA